MPNLDLMSSLFLCDYDWPLQDIFLSLDTASWRVIGCTRYRNMITDKIWEEFRYSKMMISVNKEVTSISCDEDLVVCGYIDGSCEVFNAATGDFLYKIEEQERDFIPSSSKVYLGQDIVVKIAFGTDELAHRGKSDIGIWSKISQRKICSCVHNNRNLCVYLKVHRNTLLIREGKMICQIAVVEDEVVQLKRLYKLEKMLQGEFLLNSHYLVSWHRRDISLCHLSPLSSVWNISSDNQILGLTLHGGYAAILQDYSLSVLNCANKEVQVKSLSNKQQVSITSNSTVVGVLDESHTVMFYTWVGKKHY